MPASGERSRGEPEQDPGTEEHDLVAAGDHGAVEEITGTDREKEQSGRGGAPAGCLSQSRPEEQDPDEDLRHGPEAQAQGIDARPPVESVPHDRGDRARERREGSHVVLAPEEDVDFPRSTIRREARPKTPASLFQPRIAPWSVRSGSRRATKRQAARRAATISHARTEPAGSPAVSLMASGVAPRRGRRRPPERGAHRHE